MAGSVSSSGSTRSRLRSTTPRRGSAMPRWKNSWRVRALPAGGDTSDVAREEDGRDRPGLAARLLATSGLRRGDSRAFHLGNSLGFERHGTNRRKPRIATKLTRTSSGRVVRPSGSDGSLRARRAAATTTTAAAAAASHSSSLSSSSSSGAGAGAGAGRGEKAGMVRGERRRVWNGPRGLQIHWLGVTGLREMVEERLRERRRERIRKSIGPRFMVEDGPVSDY